MDNEKIIADIQGGADIKEALSRLYENNEGLIGFCVKPYYSRPDYEDIKQEAFIGLVAAAKEYNPEQGKTFAGYAVMRIKWHLYRYVSLQTAAHIPQSLCDDILRYRQIDQGLTDGEICAALDIDGARLDEIRKAIQAQAAASLSSPIGDDLTLSDAIRDDTDHLEPIEQSIDSEIIRREVEAVLDRVKGYPAEVTRLRYFQGLTLKDTSEKLNIPYAQANNYKEKAFKELRKSVKLKQIYLDKYGASKFYHDTLSHFNYTFSSIVEQSAIYKVDRLDNND